MKIIIWANVGYVPDHETDFEISDDDIEGLTPSEVAEFIEKSAKEYVLDNILEWGWRRDE